MCLLQKASENNDDNDDALIVQWAENRSDKCLWFFFVSCRELFSRFAPFHCRQCVETMRFLHRRQFSHFFFAAFEVIAMSEMPKCHNERQAIAVLCALIRWRLRRHGVSSSKNAATIDRTEQSFALNFDVPTKGFSCFFSRRKAARSLNAALNYWLIKTEGNCRMGSKWKRKEMCTFCQRPFFSLA